eukprot:TRINITY_DN26575_c0_g1_i2.p1 TRINITY_DN26575_c0_g1~~TRINITY_DN26575_c0_g1_i2.p1  ORF type:complete len:171 (-),score=33.68 TRINITY_DN26575_c0_g1_i2:42-521(-)
MPAVLSGHASAQLLCKWHAMDSSCPSTAVDEGLQQLLSLRISGRNRRSAAFLAGAADVPSDQRSRAVQARSKAALAGAEAVKDEELSVWAQAKGNQSERISRRSKRLAGTALLVTFFGVSLDATANYLDVKGAQRQVNQAEDELAQVVGNQQQTERLRH